jgi:hypothetical protein
LVGNADGFFVGFVGFNVGLRVVGLVGRFVTGRFVGEFVTGCFVGFFVGTFVVGLVVG